MEKRSAGNRGPRAIFKAADWRVLKHLRTLSVGSLLVLVAACSRQTDVGHTQHSIARFHSAYDAGKFAEIYDQSHEKMRATGTRAEFVRFLAGAHRKLGPHVDGRQTGWQKNFSLGGQFATITYSSHFERGPAQETFAFKLGGDRPELVGYHLSSPAFIMN